MIKATFQFPLKIQTLKQRLKAFRVVSTRFVVTELTLYRQVKVSYPGIT